MSKNKTEHPAVIPSTATPDQRTVLRQLRTKYENKLRARLDNAPRDWKFIAVTSLCDKDARRDKVTVERLEIERQALEAVGKATKTKGFDYRVEEHTFDARGETKTADPENPTRTRKYYALVMYRLSKS